MAIAAVGDTGSVTITAQNTFVPTAGMSVHPGSYDVSVSGGTTSTVTFQRSFDGGSTWLDVENYTTDTQDTGNIGSRQLVRIGIKTGNFTDNAIVRIRQD